MLEVSLDGRPVGSGAGESCLADGVSETNLPLHGGPGIDAPFYDLVRGASACGTGS